MAVSGGPGRSEGEAAANRRTHYTIKRLRQPKAETRSAARWVPIGSVTINEDGTGTMYLNHSDEIWKLWRKDMGRQEAE